MDMNKWEIYKNICYAYEKSHPDSSQRAIQTEVHKVWNEMKTQTNIVSLADAFVLGQYCLQGVNCDDRNCFLPFRSPWKTVVPGRFLSFPTPVP